MPKCPACKAEISEEKKCPACGHTLKTDFGVLLASTDSEVETELLTARLRSAEIPFETKSHNDKGAFRVFLGGGIYGADVFVPPESLAVARAFTDDGGPEGETEEASAAGGQATPEEAGESSENPAQPGGGTPNTAKKGRLRLVAGLLILAVLLLLYFGLDQGLDVLRHLLGY